MKRTFILHRLLSIALTAMLLPLHVFAQEVTVHNAQPYKYLENKNQWPANVLFKMDMPAGSVFLENDRFTFDLSSQSDLNKVQHGHENPPVQGQKPDFTIHKHAYQLIFDGAKTPTNIVKSNPTKEYYNYFKGNDPSKWASGVHGYTDIQYENIYSGVKLKVYSSGEAMKYDFIVAPGADVSAIRWYYNGADDVQLLNGEMVVSTSVNTIIEKKPYAYQRRKGVLVAIPCEYVFQDGMVSFNLPEGYNKNLELIIDPALIFASYTGSTQDNWGYTATYDDLGNLYGGGIVFGSGYPVTPGAYQTTFGGGDPGLPPYDTFYPYMNGCDIAISKFSPDGSTLVYSTFIGGAGNELPHSLIVDNAGNLLIYGTSGSPDFPTTAGCYDNTFNGGTDVNVDGGAIDFPTGIDIIVAKLSADGASMLAATYIGGTGTDGFNYSTITQYNYGDHARGEIYNDAADNVYIASSTYSSNFPTTPGCFQNTIGGSQDGCIFKMNSNLSSLLWSTFIGGTSADGAYSLKLNSTGQILVAGGTASSNFPVTAGTWHSTFQGGSTDGWVARMSSDGTTMLAGTYVGTNNYDQAYFVEKDISDNIYITGQSKGAYPVTAGVYFNANGKQFITKLDPNLTAPIYSTIFGSGSSAVNISPCAFLVDNCENVYVSGWGGNVNSIFNPLTGTTTGMPVTPDALDPTTDGSDFYFFVLAKNGISLLYASFFGGNINIGEHVDGGTSRFDKAGTIYQGVCASCGGADDFPVTPGAYSEINGSTNCNLGVAKIDMEMSGIYADAIADPSFIGCAPFNIDFINTSTGGVDYVWDFGDGSPVSTLFEPSHNYTVAGTYDVMLVVIDSNSCNLADTSYLSITVLSDSISAAFDYTGNENCDSLVATFTTTGVLAPTTEFYWDFGDGTSSTSNNPTHIYHTPGSYTVTLIVTDSTSCNGIDTVTYEINYLYEFNEGFVADVSGCLPINATFTSNFTDGDYYAWDFGDGTTDSGVSVSHVYTIPGTYNVMLITYNCGIPDTAIQPVVVDDLPVAYFDDDPYYIIANTTVEFTNLSTNAVTYEWTFSDGGTSTEVNAKHIFTELTTYDVCLTATNSNGCSDTYCRQVEAEAEGALDIPTGFTPNGDGVNDILFVQGFGISDMQLLIFNRWGELVFQTTDYKQGWDGTFNGKAQEMEVYVYSLTGNFADGHTFEKKGNITLLR